MTSSGGINSSMLATLAQGSHRSTALGRTSAIKRRSNKSSPEFEQHQQYGSTSSSGPEEETESIPMEDRTNSSSDGGGGGDASTTEVNFDDMFTVATDEGEDFEFEVVNPMYNHSATTAEVASNLLGIDPELLIKPPDPKGHIRVTVISGDNMRKVTKNSKQDPYVHVTYNGYKAKTIAQSTGGLSPVWDTRLISNTLSVPYFPLYDEDEMHDDDPELEIQVWDAKDRFIGSATVSDPLAYNNAPVTVKLGLVDEAGEPAGTLTVEIFSQVIGIKDKIESRRKYLFNDLPKLLAKRGRKLYRLIVPTLRRLQTTMFDAILAVAAGWQTILMLAAPFVIISVLTRLPFALRQWILILPFAVYGYLGYAEFLGRAASAVITASILHGYPGKFKIGAIHFEPWIRDKKFYFRVCLEKVYLGNPPGFPLENLMGASLINIHGHIELEHIKNFILRRYQPSPLKRVPDFQLLVKCDVHSVDVEDILLDYQMYEGKFNLHRFTQLLAEGEAKDIGWMNGWYRRGDPMPNQFTIRVVRAKNLRHDIDATSTKSFDPFVVVKLRRDSRTTHTQTKTRDPMFNEEFVFHAEDPSIIVHVQVFNRGAGGVLTLLGQWIMTLKWFLADPYHCWYEKGMEVTADRKISGWFPLQSKKWSGIGNYGTIELQMQWHYVPEAQLQNRFEPPPLAALGQFEEWFNETLTRWGSFSRIRNWLNHEPYLFDIHRITARNVEFHLQDLFRGFKGKAETKGVENAEFVSIPLLEWFTAYRPKYPGDAGVTLWDCWITFWKELVINGVGTARTNGAVLQVTASAVRQVGEQWAHFFKGEYEKVQAITLSKKAAKIVQNRLDSAKQHAKRTVANRSAQSQFKLPVTAEDHDFLLPNITLSGYLERCARPCPRGFSRINEEIMAAEAKGKRGVVFKKKYFELKGSTLFYRKQKVLSDKSLFNITYKINLKHVNAAILFPDKKEIILGQDMDGHMTRLRFPIHESEGPENPSLNLWWEAIKSTGTKCTIWN